MGLFHIKLPAMAFVRSIVRCRIRGASRNNYATPLELTYAWELLPRVAPGGATLGFATLPHWGSTAWPFAPTGLRNKAQGCREAATLGIRPDHVLTPKGLWNYA